MRTANIFHRFHFYCLTSMRMVKRVREKAFSNSSGFRFNVTFVDCTSVFVKSVLETSLSFTYILYGSRQRARRRLACRLYQPLSALVCVYPPSHGPLRFIPSRSPLPREKRSAWGGGCPRYT